MTQRTRHESITALVDRANFAHYDAKEAVGLHPRICMEVKDIGYFRCREMPQSGGGDLLWDDIDVVTFNSKKNPASARMYTISAQYLTMAGEVRQPIELAKEVPRLRGKQALQELRKYAREEARQ